VATAHGRKAPRNERGRREQAAGADELFAGDLGDRGIPLLWALVVVPEVAVAFGMYRGLDDRLAAGGPQLQKCYATGVFPPLGAGSLRAVPPVRTPGALPPALEGRAQKAGRKFECLPGVEIHVHDPTGGLAQQDAYVLRAAVKVAVELLGA